MRNNNNGILDRVIVNNDPDFTENSSSDISATYIVLCTDKPSETGKPMCEYPICGLSLAEWVAMACDSKPVYITAGENENFLSLIKPYITKTEYTVVLYGNTPLVSKTHLKDLLEYVSIKRLNVCKLKKGFILKNEYIIDVDEIYSSLIYDLASNDFFEVNTLSDVDKIKGVLEKRMFNFHRRNGVFFNNQICSTVDANVKIGEFSKIDSGVSLINGSTLGRNCAIGKNAKITGSKIGDDVKIGDGTIVSDSIIKDNNFVGEEVMIKNSVLGNNAIVEFGSRLSSSSLRDKAVIKSFVTIDEGRIGENSIIQKHTKILGLTSRVIVGHSSEIGANSELIDCEIDANSFIENGTKISSEVN